MSQPPMPQGPPTQPLPQPAQFPLYPSSPVQPSASTTSPAPPKPNKPKRFDWPTVIITAVVAFSLGGIFVGGIFVGSGDDTATTAEPTATVTATETAEAESSSASEAPAAKKTTEAEPESTMDDGTYEIGVDAKPGRYKTRVPEDSSGCYWEKLKDDGGGLDSVIANGEVKAGGRVSITVKHGDFFLSEDCGTWTRV